MWDIEHSSKARKTIWSPISSNRLPVKLTFPANNSQSNCQKTKIHHNKKKIGGLNNKNILKAPQPNFKVLTFCTINYKKNIGRTSLVFKWPMINTYTTKNKYLIDQHIIISLHFMKKEQQLKLIIPIVKILAITSHRGMGKLIKKKVRIRVECRLLE